jgi:tetratricopeptide (TPR) repeat protein
MPAQGGVPKVRPLDQHTHDAQLVRKVTGEKAIAREKAKSGPQIVDEMAAGVLQHLRVGIDKHWHQGEYWHIVNLARIIFAGDPQDTEVVANAAYLLWSMGRDAEAEEFYRQSADANTNTYYMWDELGFFYFNRRKDYPKAVAAYEKAASCADVKDQTLHMLARAYEKVGDLKKALATWDRAANSPTNPGRGAAKMNRERVKQLLGQKA